MGWCVNFASGFKLTNHPHFQLKMPCQPLDEISGNSNYTGRIHGRFELTSNWCSHIVDHAAADQIFKVIVITLNFPFFTIKFTTCQAVSCFNNESLYQNSHSNIVDDHLCCCLLHEVCANLKIHYRDLWLNLSLHEKTVFRFSLYHVLKNKNITNWLIKKKSVLISEIAAKYL